MAPYRVLVVDDSAFMRAIISDLIVKDKQFTIAATASNGMEAIVAVKEHQPDVITMDLEMPQMNGIEALQLIMKDYPRPIIMLSGISEDNTRDTIKALQFGAFDFIRKPSGIGSDDIHSVGENLLEKLRTAAYVKTSKELLAQRQQASRLTEPPARSDQHPDIHKPRQSPRHGSSGIEPSARPAAPAADAVAKQSSPLASAKLPEQKPTNQGLARKSKKLPLDTMPESKAAAKPSAPPRPAGIRNTDIDKPSNRLVPPEGQQKLPQQPDGAFRHLVAIGTSTGGPRALHEVICSLPPDFTAPVLVVQHMPPKFTKSLAQRLDSFSPLTVLEAEQGMKLKAGTVYVAPGGYHMELARKDGGYVIQLGEQPQRNGHRPSVDVMFESLAPFRELSIHAVIMTGMGSDGAKGMKLLAEQGAASLIAEAEETCVVYGMPRCAVEGGFVQDVLPLGQIASRLVRAVTN